jgi:hypothetical protein
MMHPLIAEGIRMRRDRRRLGRSRWWFCQLHDARMTALFCRHLYTGQLSSTFWRGFYCWRAERQFRGES